MTHHYEWVAEIRDLLLDSYWTEVSFHDSKKEANAFWADAIEPENLRIRRRRRDP